MSNECKLPAVLDRLSSGPGKGATGWSARALLGLWWSDPRGNECRAAGGGAGRAGSNTASGGRASAPTFADTAAARNSTAASSHPASTVAVGGDSVVSGSSATAAGAAIHVHTCGCFSIRFVPDARTSSSAYRASELWRFLAVRLGTRARTAFAVRIALRQSRAGSIPVLYAAGSAGSAACHAGISPIVYSAGSRASDAAASGAIRACCLVDSWRSSRVACAGRAPPDQPIPCA